MARHVWHVSPLRASDHVVVIGAGLAGWRFIEILRQLGYRGAVTLIGEEAHAPYDRPPLSKQVLSGKWSLEKTTLATPEKIERANATFLLGRRAVLGCAGRGRDDACALTMTPSVAGTHIVLATGTSARPLKL